MRVSVMIPAYNEEAWITSTIASLRQALPGAEILVVDDGSSDATASLAAAAGATVCRHRRNRGKAEALATGLRVARGQVVAMVDGDMGECAGEIATLVKAVVQGQCDMAVARFARSRGGGVGLVRNLARGGIFCLTGTHLQAPLSGQRAATRELFLHCLPRRGGFGLETELSLNALKRGYRLREYPTAFVHQGQGWSWAGFRHRGRQFCQVLGALWRGGRQ